MSKTLKKALPFVLALCLLLGLIPLSGLVSAAEPAGFVSLKSDVLSWDGGNTGETGVADWSGAQTGAPAGSKLVIGFDTTAMDWKENGGDTNCWTFYIDAWSASQNAWVTIAYAGNDKCTTIFTRDGVETTTTLDFPNCPSGWIYSFPAQATGWLIIDGLNVEINDMTAVKFRPEGGSTLGSGSIGKTITIGGFGYIAPEAVEKTPVSDFEAELNMVGRPFDDLLEKFTGDAFFTLHDQNWNSLELTKDIPDGAKLVVKYDASALEGAGGVNFYIDATKVAETQEAQWKNSGNDVAGFLSAASTQLVTLLNDGTEWSKVVGKSSGTGCYGTETHLGIPVGTKGYVIISMPEGYELNDLSGFFWFRWDVVGQELLDDNFKFQIGWVAGDVELPSFETTDSSTSETESSASESETSASESESSSSDAPAGVAGDTIKGTIPAPSVFGPNYVVTDANTQTIEIGGDMCSNPTLNLRSNASASADAKAIVFRYSIPNIDLFIPEGKAPTPYWEQDRWTHVSYWNYKAFGENFTGNSAAAGGRFSKYTLCYYKDELVNVLEDGFLKWAGQLPLNCEGYVIIEMEDLQSFAQAKFGKDVTVADIEEMTFNQEWYWYEGLYNKQIYVSDIGYVKDVEQFVADFQDSYVPAYEKAPLEPAGDITVKADVIEGTYAELSWNEFEGANRYIVAVYTEDGFFGINKTRKASYTLEGLSVGTAYQVQVLPIDADEKILGASNVLDVTTKDSNTEAYTKGLLEYTDGMTAVVENEVVTWEWIDNVYAYAIHLYEANGDELTFVSRGETNDGEGSYALSDLEEGKEYVVQVVAYGDDGSIIFAYEPTDAFTAAKKDTDSTTKGDDDTDNTTAGDDDTDSTTAGDDETDDTTAADDETDATTTVADDEEDTTPTGGEDIGDDDQTQTGVATTAGVLAIASLLAGGAVVVTRKRR